MDEEELRDFDESLTRERTRADLRRATRRFMSRHWDEILLKAPTPQWLKLNPQDVQEEAEEGGCYAVLDSRDRLIYVGLALAEHDPAHPNRKAGVLRRLFRHVIRRGALSKGLMDAKRAAWNENGGIGAILILPFPARYTYLAAALEIYLIRELGRGLVMNKSRVRKELAAAA
jgi:hypothetical protein